MKHILVLKVLLLCFCIFASTNIKAQNTFIVDNIMYGIDSNIPTNVSVVSNNYSGDIIIPESVSVNGVQYSVTSIANKAFYNCTGLTSISIPSSVNVIGQLAFCLCNSLTSVTIPNSVTMLGRGAFSWSPNLASVTLSNSLTLIDYDSFRGCSSLTSITIPEGVTQIRGHAFDNCKALTSISLPNSLTSIGDTVFYSCSRLTSIILPSNITSIGGYTFMMCSRLTSITSLNPEPPVTGPSIFLDVVLNNCTLNVPIGSKQKYASSEGWNQIPNITESNTMSMKKTESSSVKVYTEADLAVVKGAQNREKIKVYTDHGVQIKSIDAQNELVKIKLPANQIYIIKIGQTAHKVVL